MQTGIHTIDIDAYHGGAGVSKSKLFTLHTRTPRHARFGEAESTAAQKFGNAAHTAVLEPNLFEVRYSKGPDDRRGNKWTAACDIAAAAGRECLTTSDYDDALRLRDALHRDTNIRRLTAGAPAIEQSAYWTDDETGELVRCRPDIFNHDMRVMADLKATVDASPYEFAKRVSDFGYHMQEAIYTEGWQAAGGGAVDAFLFITVEKKAPFAYCLYELEPAAIAEGAAVYRAALARWSACRKAEAAVRAKWSSPEGADLDAAILDAWPMYASDVQPLDLPRWAYKLTKREGDE